MKIAVNTIHGGTIIENFTSHLPFRPSKLGLV
jgi:hypothetical protein